MNGLRMRDRIFLITALSILGSSLPCSFAWGADTQNWATAAELSARKLEKDPLNEKAWADLVDARLKDEEVNDAERLKRAETALKACRSKVPKPSPVIERLAGQLAFAQGKFLDAANAWKRYLKLTPKDAEGWDLLASAYEKMHDWQKGVVAISTAQELKPRIKYLIQRARFRIRLHDWEGAKADLQAANRLDATDQKLQMLYPIFERSGKWLPAMTKLDAAVAEHSQDYRLRLDRAEWLFGVGFEDAAGDDIDAAFQANPKSLRARVWNGIISWQRDEKEKAGEVMKIGTEKLTPQFEAELKAMDSEPDAETRARFLMKIQQPLLALGEVRAVDGSPSKALALLKLNRLPQAGKAARRATQAHPEDAGAWLALGQVELENGNNSEALAALDLSLKLKGAPEVENLRKIVLRRLGKK